MHKFVDNLRDSLDQIPLDWANMPNLLRHYEGVTVVAPKTFRLFVRLNRDNGEHGPPMRWISFHSSPTKKILKPSS